MQIYPTKRVREMTQMLCQLLYEEKIAISKLVENIDSIVFKPYMIGLSPEWYQTNKYNVNKFKIGNIFFVIKKEEAKRIKLNPWHKVEFGIYRYNYYKKQEDMPSLRNNEIRSESDAYLFTRIVFMTMNYNGTRKKFELQTFLRLLWKLNHSNLIEVEKFLFEVLA